MIDPEVARLRRLRSEALQVREVARSFRANPWAADESLLDLTACAGWRISRVVSGRLRSHPYTEYQKDAGAASRAIHRLNALYLALTRKNRLQALNALQIHVNTLGRQLNDAISLAWSSDFSEALSRCQFELKALESALAVETRSVVAHDRDVAHERPVLTPASSRPAAMVGHLGAAFEGDWPYLAL